MKKYLVELSAFIFQNVFDDFNSMLTKNLNSFSCNGRVWIAGANHNSGNA